MTEEKSECKNGCKCGCGKHGFLVVFLLIVIVIILSGIYFNMQAMSGLCPIKGAKICPLTSMEKGK